MTRPKFVVTHYGVVQPWIDYADALEAELKVHLENLNSQDAKIDRLRDDCKFLLSFAPKDCPEHLDPTFYHTLSYEGDKKNQDRIDAIREALEGEHE